eukprot:363888-Chlamydomonas_euryale.AAC.14
MVRSSINLQGMQLGSDGWQFRALGGGGASWMALSYFPWKFGPTAHRLRRGAARRRSFVPSIQRFGPANNTQEAELEQQMTSAYDGWWVYEWLAGLSRMLAMWWGFYEQPASPSLLWNYGLVVLHVPRVYNKLQPSEFQGLRSATITLEAPLFHEQTTFMARHYLHCSLIHQFASRLLFSSCVRTCFSQQSIAPPIRLGSAD